MYRIIVEKVEEKLVEEKEYQVINEDENGKNEYGYVTVPNKKKITTNIYEQTVDNIDIVEVITAVNKSNEK